MRTILCQPLTINPYDFTHTWFTSLQNAEVSSGVSRIWRMPLVLVEGGAVQAGHQVGFWVCYSPPPQNSASTLFRLADQSIPILLWNPSFNSTKQLHVFPWCRRPSLPTPCKCPMLIQYRHYPALPPAFTVQRWFRLHLQHDGLLNQPLFVMDILLNKRSRVSFAFLSWYFVKVM